jgi:cytoskeletal protein CcmA (bactofilin family)
MKKLQLFVVFVLTISLSPVALFAASEFGNGPAYTLPAGQTVNGNLYAGGASINVLGTVGKDVMAAGGNVLLAGTTTGSVMAAGGSLSLTAPVGADARLAGGNISIAAPVGGELVAGAGNLVLEQNAIVGGDAFLAGNQIVLNGGVIGNVRIAAQQVTINGTIGKNVVIRAQKIVFGRQARIGGDVSYQSAERAQIAPGAVIAGRTTFSKISMPERYSWGNTLAMLGLTWLFKLIAILVAVLVAFLVLPKRTTEVAVRAADNFWYEVLRGLIILVVVPVVLLILLFSVVGIMLALIGLLAYILMLLLAAVLSAFTLAGVLQKYAFKESVASITWPKLLLATLILMILGLIPVLGWLAAFVFYLAALGAFAQVTATTIRR